MALGAIGPSDDMLKRIGGAGSVGSLLSSDNINNAVNRIVHTSGSKNIEKISVVSGAEFKEVMKDALAGNAVMPGRVVDAFSSTYFDNKGQAGMIGGIDQIV